MLHVVVINVSYSLCDLTSWKSTTKCEHVLSNLSIERFWRLSVEKRVIKVIATPNNLNIIDVVTIDGRQADTAIVHLTSENFVTEEVVTEDSAVRVGKIMGVGPGHIYQVTKHGMHRIVLLMNIIKMTSIFINSIGAEQVFEEQETIVVLMFDSWGIVENTNIGVDHFIITNKQDSWDIDWFLSISGWNVCLSW